MANYIVPQVLINQLISEVPLNTIKNQNVLVIGPNYQLYRFNEEKDQTYIGEYINSTEQEGGGIVNNEFGEQYTGTNLKLLVDNLAEYAVIPYPNQAASTIPDASYTKVYADEVLIKLMSLGDFYLWDDPETVGLDAILRFPFALTGDKAGYATKLTCRCTYKPIVDENGVRQCVDTCGDDVATTWHTAYDTTISEPIKKFERSLNVGDVIRIPYKASDGTETAFVSTIVDILESSEGSGIFDCVQLADTLPVDLTALAEDGTQSADESDDYSVPYEYKKFNAEDDNSTGPVSSDIAYGNCDDSDTNDITEGADTVNAVQLCARFSDVEVPRKTAVRHIWNWDTYVDAEPGNLVDTYGIVVTGNLRIAYSNWTPAQNGVIPEYRVLSAKLYVEHRDLITSTASSIASIASSTLVESALGTISPDNPLAFGVYMATINSGDKIVYYCGVDSDDLSGYNKAMQKATLTNDVYMICPTTTDITVAQAVESHVAEMSTAENKKWRIGFVAMEPPAVDPIYDHTNNPSGTDFYAKLISPQSDNSYNILQFMFDSDENNSKTNTVVRCITDVKVGDVVKIWLLNSDDDWDDTRHYTERYVKKVLSNNTLQLDRPIQACVSGIDDGDDTNDHCMPDMIPAGLAAKHFKVEVYRKLDATDQVKYIAAQSSSLATRRMYNVFPSIASNADFSFDGSFLACAVAGLVSSVLPQQPITNVELNGITDLPIVYQTYTAAQLNEIAAGGTLIVMQDQPNGQVYVRHQISTDYTSNNLLKAELSITKNLDSISYYLVERFAPYIGKYNITPDLIGVLSNVLNESLLYLATDTAAGLYGAQVISEGTEVLYLRQSTVNRDRIQCRVHLNLPVPFNYFDLDLEI